MQSHFSFSHISFQIALALALMSRSNMNNLNKTG
jgi:hypothetical protein